MRIGVLSSVATTIDAFFPSLIDYWCQDGAEVFSASAGFSTVNGTTHTTIQSLGQSPTPRVALRAPAEIARWVETNRLDVVLTNTATASALCRLRRPRAAVVYLCHGFHWRGSALRTAHWQAIERLLMRRTDHILVMNDADERFAGEFGPGADRVSRLPYGVGLNTNYWSEVRSALPPVTADSVVLWAGQFTSRKRPADALDVMRRLGKEEPAPTIRMAGTGPLLPKMRREAKRLDLDIQLPGHLSSTELFSDVRAVLHTAEWEGFCRLLLEAVYLGIPVVAYDTKGVRDIPGVDASVAVGNVAHLAERLAVATKFQGSERLRSAASGCGDRDAWRIIDAACRAAVRRRAR